MLELVTFYPGFRQKAPGKYHIRVCRTLSCAMAGCFETMDAFCAKAGIDRAGVSHHDPIAVSEDGKFSIEFAECLASCGTGPVCMVGDDFHENVKPGDVGEVLETSTTDDGEAQIHQAGKEPHPREHRMIFRNVDRQGWDPSPEDLREGRRLQGLARSGPQDGAGRDHRGGESLRPARPRRSGLSPPASKWTFIPKGNTKPVYLICNCDESEPGTFKDRYIVHQDPHQLLEGMLISCFAVGAKIAYIYIREEFPEGARILEAAIEEARAKNYLGKGVLGSGFDCEIYVHRGAGAYICGEETGLIESLEGKRPYPRIKPPYFPAALGLYMCPTIVNNVESLCHVKHIIAMGSEKPTPSSAPRATPARACSASAATCASPATSRWRSASSPWASSSTTSAAA